MVAIFRKAKWANFQEMSETVTIEPYPPKTRLSPEDLPRFLAADWNVSVDELAEEDNFSVQVVSLPSDRGLLEVEDEALLSAVAADSPLKHGHTRP